MTPVEACKKKNESTVYFNLYGDMEQLSSKPRFKIGDKIRISKYKRKVFDKDTHLIGSRVEIYWARWKFMLISDQAKDLVKNCVEGGGCMSPFQPLVYIRDLE